MKNRIFSHNLLRSMKKVMQSTFLLALMILALTACISVTSPTGVPTLAPASTPQPIQTQVTVREPQVQSVDTQTAVPAPSGEPGQTKTYTSTLYSYQVSYPADWKVQVNTSVNASPGKLPEYVTFASGPDGKLPNITIYSLTGVPPFTGYENCQSNLVFRGLNACRISVPAGQIPATELIVFHNGDQNFEIAMQYEGQEALGLFDQFMRSFQFTKAVIGDPNTPVMKTYASKEYGYSVNYPADWTAQVNTSVPAGPGSNPEYVTLTPNKGTNLPRIEIEVLTGAPPMVGYENCDRNFVFRNLPACHISQPAGQNPAAELWVFQNGTANFYIAMQYQGSEPVQLFNDFLSSFEFTQ